MKQKARRILEEAWRDKAKALRKSGREVQDVQRLAR